jgi:hypothetical protein
MLNQTTRLAFAAAAATALSATALAQNTALETPELFRVSDTGALIRTAYGTTQAGVSRDGGATWIPLPSSAHEINWRGRLFDPKDGDPSIARGLRAPESNELFYVQFVTDIVPEYAVALRQLGTDYTRYHPNQAYIARIPGAATTAIESLPYVRAVMELTPGHKMDEEVQTAFLNGALTNERYNILLVDKHRDAAALEARIVELGGTVDSPSAGGILLEATLTPSQLISVTGENTVLWVERWGAPESDINILRIEAGVDFVETVAGIDGKGIRGHVNEGIHNHVEFAAIPPWRGPKISLMGNGTSSHGTNTAGEIYALGLPGGTKGILPFGQMIHSPSVNGSRYSMVQQLVDPNDQYRAMIMTQSWGGPRTFNYTGTSALLDDILFDFDHMFSTQSQSNAGNQDSRPEAWGKNVCGIGGFLHKGTTNINDDCHCNTGSTGPAQDGRVGVTFSAYYDGIRTTSSTTGYTNSFGGTSGATPIVNGLGGCAIQMFTDGLLGYPAVPWDERFAARPNLTTTRVLLAISTRQRSFTGGNVANRFEQGWGLPNLQDIYDNRDKILLLDEEDVLNQGQRRIYRVFVKPNTPEFRASMHHLEDEAVPSAIPTRINSLDLTVRDPNGNTYWGNGNGILSGPWSSPGGSANDLDTHENVFIQNPASGSYQVTVRAPVLRGDSHKETPGVDADFALAIRGIGGGRDKSGMVLDLDSSSPLQFAVSLSNVPATGWSYGRTIFTRSTHRHVSLGNYYGLELDQLSEQLFGMTPSAGNIFAFTNTGNPGQYPSATWNFSAAQLQQVQGARFDAVVLLFDANDVLVDVSNVQRVKIL